MVFSDGEIHGKRKREIRKHVAECDRCAESLREMGDISSLVRFSQSARRRVVFPYRRLVPVAALGVFALVFMSVQFLSSTNGAQTDLDIPIQYSHVLELEQDTVPDEEVIHVTYTSF
jgi:hypothetical protein